MFGRCKDDLDQDLRWTLGATHDQEAGRKTRVEAAYLGVVVLGHVDGIEDVAGRGEGRKI